MSWQQRIQQAIQQRKEDNLWRQRINVASPQGARIILEGQSLLNFSSNDYLGLAQQSESLMVAAKTWGMGSGASHLVCGHSQAHQQLEQALAHSVGYPRALLFANGYMANLAVLQTLLNRQDHLYQDKLNHASLIDGGLISSCKMRRYRHNDSTHLAYFLEQEKMLSSLSLVATDAVFSMDGDQANLSELADICQQHEALLMVDDAHGFGVLGNGEYTGSIAEQNLSSKQVPIYMGTLGKGLGGYGAFVAGSEDLIEYLIQFARPYIYTTALPAALASAMQDNLAIVMSGERQKVLASNITYFRQQARYLELNIMPSSTAIQPLLIGDDAKAVAISQQLKPLGILVTAIRPPTVAKGSARLRITLTASHTEQDIDHLLTALVTLLMLNKGGD
ncbi:MAG: 8-amino-7-oxononanoate synthase [Oleispira antarctica]|uniref:8-amino-7-oxononanoate synthase n=1 Tax=Oleispira antarctica RB-8 TaxID=698738 RepID=R4YLQ0_OLEAN|nr:8-amino-7-oxononanoate synthase [Oleispira antarctica]MBQ0792893.1 8-amino-7-oxononanoate synthase [Oleispira antarctica]CCK75470.1 8-amino-7-oxononanoate synthase [Oleispira antarctica RB-8]